MMAEVKKFNAKDYDDLLMEIIKVDKFVDRGKSKKMFEALDVVQNYRALMSRIDELKSDREIKSPKFKSITTKAGEVYTVGDILLFATPGTMQAHMQNKPIVEIEQRNTREFVIKTESGQKTIIGVKDRTPLK